MVKEEFKTEADFLRNARENSGFTQKDVAKRLGFLSAQMISNWERSYCAAPIEVAVKLCKLFKVSYKQYCDIRLEREALRLKRAA